MRGGIGILAGEDRCMMNLDWGLNPGHYSDSAWTSSLSQQGVMTGGGARQSRDTGRVQV